MSRIVASTVGYMVGDCWTTLPYIVELCKSHEVQLVCGTYAKPVWEWGQKYVRGADYKIIRTIKDPDVVEHPFCPGKGYLAIMPAFETIRDMMPEETVIRCDDTLIQNPAQMETIGVDVVDGDYIVVHPYTKHDWKNCRMVVRDVKYTRPVKAVGLPGEYEPGDGWEMLSELGFDAMVNSILGAAGFVGVLSSFTNVATLFKKKQIIVSFTPDIPQVNDRAVKLVEPSVEELQLAVTEMGL